VSDAYDASILISVLQCSACYARARRQLAQLCPAGKIRTPYHCCSCQPFTKERTCTWRCHRKAPVSSISKLSHQSNSACEKTNEAVIVEWKMLGLTHQQALVPMTYGQHLKHVGFMCSFRCPQVFPAPRLQRIKRRRSVEARASSSMEEDPYKVRNEIAHTLGSFCIATTCYTGQFV
jgi:hypothetical protein